MPFNLAQGGRSDLFVWAMDWTGVTHGGNTTPDWWFWENFGTTALSDTNLDSGGFDTLADDYQNGVDPNPISFDVQFDNLRVSASYATGKFLVEG